MTTNPQPTEDQTALPQATGETDTSATDGHDPIEVYRRFAVHALVIVFALAVLGFLPTRRLAGDAGLLGMAAALIADLAASAAGTLPIWWSRHRHPSHSVGAQLGAMGLRLAVVLVLGIAVALSGLVPIPAFLIWLAIGHSGLLVADTLFARSVTSYAMQNAPAPKTSTASSARGSR